MEPKPLHILISPLDWGLGHASRCIPVIRELLKAGHKVTVAGYGRSLILLQKEFPNLKSIELTGFSPSYSKKGSMTLHLFLLLPRFLISIFSEYRNLNRVINKYHFDVIISDNRYGLRNKKINSILITHQVMIKTPGYLKFAEYPLYRISRLLISRFNECWIPDYGESPGLSGDLSHKYPLPKNTRYIGPLSRFRPASTFKEKNSVERKITAIISGPEPQRSIFEDLLTRQLDELNLPATILSGKPESEDKSITTGKLTIRPHISTDKIISIINSSSIVICRSGYSSIMDLHALGLKALFVPTPGQTEQIYLAELHQKQGNALCRKQESVNLSTDIEEAQTYPGFKNSTMETSIGVAVRNLKNK